MKSGGYITRGLRNLALCVCLCFSKRYIKPHVVIQCIYQRNASAVVSTTFNGTLATIFFRDTSVLFCFSYKAFIYIV